MISSTMLQVDPAEERAAGARAADLTIAIPSVRSGQRVRALLEGLAPADGGRDDVRVVVARPKSEPLQSAHLADLPERLSVRQLCCTKTQATAMRNAIVASVESSHVLLLDDDMVPAPGLYDAALACARRAPDAVHQGPPYRVANAQSWLARMEGRLYEQSYGDYVRDDAVSLLDARLLLAPTAALRQAPFDESFRFAGEGREMAQALSREGFRLRLAPELVGYHLNRDTLSGLWGQKRLHGWGRAHALRQNGPGPGGWSSYLGRYAVRHFAAPVGEWRRGALSLQDVVYRWTTNGMFWAGVAEGMVRRGVSA